MRAGDTFRIKDKNIDEHLWVILSEPDIDDSKVVIVNMTTAHPSKEQFCLIQIGEHPFVVHETCVSYQHARVTSLAKLIQLRDRGTNRAATTRLIGTARSNPSGCAALQSDADRARRDHRWATAVLIEQRDRGRYPLVLISLKV